jgi:hypothetical protein
MTNVGHRARLIPQHIKQFDMTFGIPRYKKMTIFREEFRDLITFSISSNPSMD